MLRIRRRIQSCKYLDDSLKYKHNVDYRYILKDPVKKQKLKYRSLYY